MRVGFVGLGNMGAPMARNVVAAGFDTVVTDLDPTRVEALVAAGATAADSIGELAHGAELVLTSLPGPAQVASVGSELIAAMAPGSAWVDLSTNDLGCARSLSEQAASAGVHLLDAPVTGGAEGAEAATLTVLVGGERAVFDRCLPVLEAIGERIELLGPHGAGYVAKISQVVLCYMHSVCLTEALLLGTKGGVDPATMLDVIRHSTGRSYAADRYGPEILDGGYDATFDLGLAAKDLRLAGELADQVGARLPFLADIVELYAEAEVEFGFAAPHLMAVRSLERDNDLILHHHHTGKEASP